jgi:hypothetical protein
MHNMLGSYSAELRDLVDLRQLDRNSWDELWHDWREDWRYWKFDQHIQAPTWVLSDLVRDSGYTGIVFSVRRTTGEPMSLFSATDFTATIQLKSTTPASSSPKISQAGSAKLL